MILTVSDSANSYLQFMTVLIMFVFVLAITYFTTKWIAGYQQSKGAGANLEVIESFRLADNKYVRKGFCYNVDRDSGRPIGVYKR